MKVRHVWAVLRDRKPIFVNGGTHKGMLIFTSEAEATGYLAKRGGDKLSVEQWDIPAFLQVLGDLAPIMEKWEITWLIVNHPGESNPEIMHLKLADLTALPKHHRILRFSSALPSLAE